MKSHLLLLCLALPALAAEPNQLTPAEKNDGFKLIFDGKTTDGWRTYKEEKASDKVEVKDGALVLSDGSGNLITKDQYTDFELRFQFQIAADGNSGVLWHATEEGKYPYESGPEFQILDSFAKNEYAPEIKKGNIAGAFYDIVPGKTEWAKPAGEWNDGIIKVVGSKITLTFNGHVSAEVDTSTDEWKQLLAKSKFATWPLFNKSAKGFICLQEHGDRVAFRSIRIKTL